MNSLELPPPYGGVDEHIPEIALRDPFAARLLNFNPGQAGVSLRHGDLAVNPAVIGAATTPCSQAAFNNNDLISIFWRSDTGVLVAYENSTLIYTHGAPANADLFGVLSFNKNIFFLAYQDTTTAYAPGFVYDGTTFGVLGWTGTGFHPVGGAVHNSRAFLIQKNEPAYWYTDIDAISGAVTKVDLGGQVGQQAILSTIGTFTLADTVSAVVLVAYIFSDGEVLFYSGKYPNSSDWALQGRAKISVPMGMQVTPHATAGRRMGYNQGFQAQGDYLVMTDNGLVSMRDLFLKGSEAAASLTLSTPVEKVWKVLSSSQATPWEWTGVWDDTGSRLIILSPQWYNFETQDVGDGFQAFFFIYDMELQSWFYHKSFNDVFGAGFLTKLGRTILYTGHAENDFIYYQKEGSTGFVDKRTDEDINYPYEYDIISAAVMEGRSHVQKCAGLDVIVESDLHAQTNYQLIRDFGVASTQPQKVNAISGSLQKPFVNLGIEGSFIQYRIYGTTVVDKTVGYNLYGINYWSERGRSPR